MRTHAPAQFALSPARSPAAPFTNAASGPATAPSPAGASSVRARYAVSGLADAGLLPRVLEPVAKLGLVPEQVTAGRMAPVEGADFTVLLALADVSPRHAELVALALRAIVGVRDVVATVETASPSH
jgi:hypothetical protein